VSLARGEDLFFAHGPSQIMKMVFSFSILPPGDGKEQERRSFDPNRGGGARYGW
jgi:hypothetical protein